MTSFPSAMGKCIYGAFFVVFVPFLLVVWADATAEVIPISVPPFRWLGLLLSALGTLLMLAGTSALWVHGHGLPMSLYPPPDYVSRGVYRLMTHPIYVGFAMLCFGVSAATESSSGFWLISPCVALGCTALVLGFERHEIRKRFGENVVQRPLLSLPIDSTDAPSGWDRLSVILLVLLPWALVFEAVFFLGVPPDAIEAYLPFERGWPVWQWTEAIYASVYLFVPLSLFVVPSRKSLRRFAVLGLIATPIVTLIYLTLPIIAPPKPFGPPSTLGQILMLERELANTVAAFPAFHVIWSLIAAEAWSSRSRSCAIIGWSWAALITISCVTTGMHALADLVAAIVFFGLLRSYKQIWRGLRQAAERVANSWWEWRLGRVRFINHGVYAGLSGVVGLTIVTGLAGPEAFWQLVIILLIGLVSAGLWAQTLEGSSKLSRPFGYYGSVLGVLIATPIVGAVGSNTMELAAVIAVAGPWVQCIGRMRCLVQGCCHGRETVEKSGIRYWRERSRVCTIGDLRGVFLYPTPLYSMLGNGVIGVILLRLWSLGAPFALIVGVYLILAGLARFVEESYRGEPQTPVIAGLRLYQWLAVFSFVLGAVFTTIPSDTASDLSFHVDTRVLIAALIYGLISTFAMGLDFPQSDKRFARLAPP